MNWRQRYKTMFAKGQSGTMSYKINDSVINFMNDVKKIIKVDSKCNTIIDYGCGTAKLADFLVDLFKAKNYIGYDIVDFVIEDNRKRFPQYDFVLVKDEIAKCDVIWCSFSLQHIDDNNAVDVLLHFRKAIKKTGKMYIVNAIIEGTDTPDMFFRNAKRHNELFKKASLKSKLIGTVKVTNSDVGIFEVSK